jgi:nitrogen regulatory protein PII
LIDAGISSITVKEVLGRGKGMVDLSLLKGAELGYEEAIAQLGQSQRLIPKRLLMMVLPDELVQRAVDTIISVNQVKNQGTAKYSSCRFWMRFESVPANMGKKSLIIVFDFSRYLSLSKVIQISE